LNGTIRFKPEMLDLVLEGKKTSTIRPNGRSDYGPILTLTDGSRRVEAECISVQHLRLSEALQHYREEGFESQQQLAEALASFYPWLEEQDEVTFIRFRPKI